jgi:hypothetical protein
MFAQPLICRPGKLCEERESFVLVVDQTLLDHRLVELADLGRDLLEARMARQFAP